ncbi:interferon-induced guanylate-binding protein, putative [Perkinsus marinus ATCC 50983]|uniref:Interferon-induced guanylate-binding protein, putative n=1 Tax=Perkinsus marinus (strain ATCC 50983 / TXsc) TaxID=423536 RepID=C5KQU3_PERM5|nr:interferon-induced guanylate-binding protein, putative [Perkinsus marinus ATCC 50983]EER13189.1 interferon-induced guanylate-binding protein, putative [Perkinsus marinus ATCC 50983]|eukprot:XP_002781394.1 interferon-induced guanylate-binding protein, putative [Perkinsus marinus ATCC 50983]
MASSYHGGPVQLISIDESGQCTVDEYAFNILRRGKVAVLGIDGLYRTGKNPVMNRRLLGLQDGFEIGPSVNPCTRGIWMWVQPVQLGQNFHAILIDTEGLGSCVRTTSSDMQILSLCLLLCSFFVYNSMGAINEESLDQLNLVLHLTKHIHVVRSSFTADSADLAADLPPLLWKLPYQALMPQFQQQVDAFVEKVDGMNSSAVPTIRSAWTNVVVRDAVHVYRVTMNEDVMQKLLMSEEEVRGTLNKRAW